MTTLRIFPVKNGFVIGADDHCDPPLLTPDQVTVAANASDLAEIIRDWAIDEEKARDGRSAP